jgi:hypothetical protein
MAIGASSTPTIRNPVVAVATVCPLAVTKKFRLNRSLRTLFPPSK